MSRRSVITRGRSIKANDAIVIDDDEVAAMVLCDRCGDLIPETNLYTHQLSCDENPSTSTRNGSGPSSTNNRVRETNVINLMDSPPVVNQRPRRHRRIANGRSNNVEVDCSASSSSSLRNRASRNNGNNRINPENVIDLSSGDGDEIVTVEETRWPCSRCTFLNSIENYRCEVCLTAKGGVEQNSSPMFTTTNGAIMGSVIGGVSASFGGRIIASGATYGAISGALAGELLNRSSSSSTSSSRSSSHSHTFAAVRARPRHVQISGRLHVTRAQIARRDMFREMAMQQFAMSQINSTRTYGASDLVIESLPCSKITKDDEDTECCICLDALKVGDSMRRLPCLHAFHQECVDKWLKSNATCPMCKHQIN